MQSIAERAWEKVHRGKRISELCFGFKENNLYHSRKECDRMISEKGTLLSDKKEEPLGSSFCMVRGKAMLPDSCGVKRYKMPGAEFPAPEFSGSTAFISGSFGCVDRKKVA